MSEQGSKQVETSPEQAALKSELAELLAYVRQQTEAGVESGKAFVSQQAPLVAKEIIAQEIALSGLGLGFALVLAMAAVVGRQLLWRAHLRAQEKSGEYEDGFAAGAIATAIVCGAASLVIGICNTITLVQVLVAPRLVVLDYIRRLL